MCPPRYAVSRRALLAAALGSAAVAAGCGTAERKPAPAAPAGAGGPTGSGTGTATPSAVPTPAPTTNAAAATPAQVRSRATVPVLCYHQVRNYEGGDTSYNRQVLICPPANFRAQLDAIQAAGYTTIGPDQYRDHLLAGAALPAKPVLLSFDDGKDNQASTILPELTKRSMTGTFFIMTVILGNPGWITKRDVARIADAGMTIGCHTWDHHDVRKYAGKDWATQFEESRATLQKASGQPVDSFAYPYGAWNPAALPHLASAGYTTAYQLDEKPLDPRHPQLTLRRALAVSTWSGPQVVAKLDALAATRA